MFFSSYIPVLLFMLSFGNIECFQWDSTSIVILLCITKYTASGKSQEVDLFQLFSADFSCLSYVLYCLTYCTIFLFIKFISYLWLFQFFPFWLSFPSTISFRWNKVIFFFCLKCFHPCLQDLNSCLTQFISGCCCLAVLQEATVAPVLLVTNIGKCKVRKVFGSVTFSGCIFWIMCKDLALWGTSAWTVYDMSICGILLKEEF